jgi:hypothetical protein
MKTPGRSVTRESPRAAPRTASSRSWLAAMNDPDARPPGPTTTALSWKSQLHQTVDHMAPDKAGRADDDHGMIFG